LRVKINGIINSSSKEEVKAMAEKNVYYAESKEQLHEILGFIELVQDYGVNVDYSNKEHFAIVTSFSLPI
jgi:hypothetical protein